MNIQDKLQLHGNLTITSSRGDTLLRENIIVQQSIFNILSGFVTATTSSPVASLQLGTGGTSDSAGLFPLPPSYTQTQLNDYLTTIPVSAYNLALGNNYVTFTASLGQSEYNGINISEAALFTQSGLMFNYTTFPAINKSSLFGLSFTWNVGF